jgi:hypothetical protein
MTHHSYRSRGVRALVLLHERHLRSCIAAWQEAKRREIGLLNSTDSPIGNLESLLLHILEAARDDFLWICDRLVIARPPIDPLPTATEVAERVADYVESLLQCWAVALVDVTDEQLYGAEYVSDWGTAFTINGMLEHIVMHAIRHEFQLDELLNR